MEGNRKGLSKQQKEQFALMEKVLFPRDKSFGWNDPQTGAQQITKMRYNIKTDDFTGLIYYEKDGKKRTTEYNNLSKEWVLDNFKPRFYAILRAKAFEVRNQGKVWTTIPAGDPRTDGERTMDVDTLEEKYEIKFLRFINIKFQQKENSYCVGYSLASVLYFVKFHDLANRIRNLSEKISNMPANRQMEYVTQILKVQFQQYKKWY